MENYLQEIQKYFQDVNSSEMSYRTPFQNFLESIFKREDKFLVQHDQKTINGNKPDFILLKNNVPILYIEVKKVGEDLDKIEKTNQIERYSGYPNLILSDYINFRFYRYGKKANNEISLGEINKKDLKIGLKLENLEHLKDTIISFVRNNKVEIEYGKHLAEIMGSDARRIRDEINSFFEKENEEDSLHQIYKIIKDKLVYDIDSKKFADMYAQTLVYGLFAARYNDESSESFSRSEARDLISDSNPFLRYFFDHIAGINFDKRLSYIVDELCEVFKYADVGKLIEDFYGKEKGELDPIIHFYEDFLEEYDSELRKQMGAYYTPTSIVNFMVKSIDEILQTEFDLPLGLNTTDKLPNGYHKVQVLDPATGTGTFISKIIGHIYKKIKQKKQEGTWPSYVLHNLVDRIHGFELMMAPYVIAHIKIGLAFKKTGFKYFNNKRLRIFLTNTLENLKNTNSALPLIEGVEKSLSNEAIKADEIKNDYPIMCIVGNPPYSISSNNKSDWILNLIEEYKKNLNERKINLDDDYIKFIRFGQYMIDKNGEGILAYISNNSFISGITHRQMRKSLLESFSKIYIVDLHGNSRIKEISPNGSRDQNVFDIMQGVSINIFIKKKDKKENELGQVYHYDLYGDRKDKYNFLDSNVLSDLKWQELKYSEPYYFFIPKDFGSSFEYEKGFIITDLFKIYSAGIKTKVDNISIDFDKSFLNFRIKDIIQTKYSLKDLITKFELNPKTTWEYNKVLEIQEFFDNKIVLYSYRPFDNRFIYFDKNFLSRSRSEVMDNFFEKDNIGLETSRNGDYVFISQYISDEHFVSDNSFKFPLYIYKGQNEKIPNLDKEIWKKINEVVGETNPENILDYIYAVLHSPKYRETYKEFLKIDFPRVPYPKDKKEFDRLVELGNKLRNLHLMTDNTVNDFITTYSIAGENLVEKVKYENGNVYINKEQYFGNVPEIAWNFYIGGYQPAQKYLKDRKGRNLTSDEIEHYQKIIKVLFETDKLMKEIDK